MKELFCTNDAVLLSFAEALLKEADIQYAILDGNMSIMEGSIGILPRRVLVPEDQWDKARRILKDAGIDETTGDASFPS